MKKSFTSPLLGKLARRAGAKLVSLPDWEGIGQLRFASGKCTYFIESTFDLNPQAAAKIARDKDAAGYFMRSLGYPVPESVKFFSRGLCRKMGLGYDPGRMWERAAALGLPFFLKPNSSGQGIEVHLVGDHGEFRDAAAAVFRRDRVMLAQALARGRDYRIVVLDSEVMAAYERIPASIRGDGRSTIRRLLELKNETYSRRATGVRVALDSPRVTSKLRRQGLTADSIPAPGCRVALLDNANLSAGGDVHDVTEAMHPGFAEIAVRLTRDMGLRLSGVDLMVEGEIAEPPARYSVLEINASPGLRQYASFGAAERRRTERLYAKIFEAVARG